MKLPYAGGAHTYVMDRPPGWLELYTAALLRLFPQEVTGRCWFDSQEQPTTGGLGLPNLVGSNLEGDQQHCQRGTKYEFDVLPFPAYWNRSWNDADVTESSVPNISTLQSLKKGYVLITKGEGDLHCVTKV